MSITTWQEVLSNGVARVPMSLPKFMWCSLYTAFEEFTEFVSSHPEYSTVFNDSAKAWQANSGLRLHYSGYFSPYYRSTAGQRGKDNKKIVQLCEPYYRHLCESQPTLLEIPEFRRLIEGLMAAMYSSFAKYLPFIYAMRDFDPALAEALMPRDTTPPVVIRLLSYYSDDYYFTNPHVDKNAVTVILDTDEPEDSPCLVFAPYEVQTAPSLSTFAPVSKREDEALMFLGASPREAGYGNYIPAIHAVRPLEIPAMRHAAVFFWLLPGIDLEGFSTSVPFIDDLKRARLSLSK